MKTIATVATALLALLLGSVPAHAEAPENAAPWSGHCWKTGYYSYVLYSGEGGRIEVTLGEGAEETPTYWAHRCTDNGVRYDVSRANTAAEVLGLRAMVRDANRGPGVPALFCRTGSTSAYAVEWSWYTRGGLVEQPGERARYTAWALDWKRAHDCVGARWMPRG